MKAILALILVWQTAAFSRAMSEKLWDQPVLETRYFLFHSHFWVNFHHYLYQQAAYVRSRKIEADADRIARFLKGSGQEATDAEGAAILKALAFYEDNLIDLKLTFDPRMHKIKAALTQTGPEERAPLQRLEPELSRVLAACAPVFERALWEEQDRMNQAWIASQKKWVEDISEEMVAGLIHWYGVPWPEEKIRIDLCGSFTHWAGAYTTVNPNHVVISSTRKSYKGFPGLEMVFHESSHIPLSRMSGPIHQTIAQKSEQLGVPVPEDLWHGILFYTTGELARRVLAKRGIRHEPYMFLHDVFKRYHEVLTAHWQPYMDGEGDLGRAIEAMVGHLKAAPAK